MDGAELASNNHRIRKTRAEMVVAPPLKDMKKSPAQRKDITSNVASYTAIGIQVLPYTE